MTLLTCSSNT